MPRIVRPGTRRSQLGFEPLAPQAFPVAIQHGTPPRSWNLRFHKYNEADRQLPAAPRAPGPVEPVQRLTGEVANWPSAHRLSGAKIDFEALDPHLVDNIAAWNYQEKRVIEEPPAEAELVQMMRERLASTGAFVDESGYDQVIEQTRPGKPMFIYPKEKTLMPPGFDVFHRGARKSIVPPDEIPVDPLSAPFKKIKISEYPFDHERKARLGIMGGEHVADMILANSYLPGKKLTSRRGYLKQMASKLYKSRSELEVLKEAGLFKIADELDNLEESSGRVLKRTPLSEFGVDETALADPYQRMFNRPGMHPNTKHHAHGMMAMRVGTAFLLGFSSGAVYSVMRTVWAGAGSHTANLPWRLKAHILAASTKARCAAWASRASFIAAVYNINMFVITRTIPSIDETRFYGRAVLDQGVAVFATSAMFLARRSVASVLAIGAFSFAMGSLLRWSQLEVASMPKTNNPYRPIGRRPLYGRHNTPNT